MDRLADLDPGRAAANPGRLKAGVPMDPIDLAVVGGGWAGLAAAIESCVAGRPPTLFESAPRFGGRARGVSLRLGAQRVTLDNGQHLLIGAYREWSRVAAIAGVRPGEDFVRRRMRLRSTDGLDLRAWPLPAPLHLLGGLLGARGLRLDERTAIVRLMASLRRANWQVPAGETVSALLARLAQPHSLVARLWAPLAYAALNTAPEHACARAFAAVLRDSLGADARASDFVLPRGTLSDLLPEPALRWLGERGARPMGATAVRAMTPEAGCWRIDTTRGSHLARRVVLAVPAYVAAGLLSGSASTARQGAVLRELERFEYDGIATVYLAWPASPGIDLPAWQMLDERAGPQDWGQWLFDRGVQGGLRIAAVVVSARARLADVPPEALAAGIAAQAARQLRLPAPAHARTIVEKRATIRCTPARPRLTPDSLAACAGPHEPWQHVALAGDYAYPDYPATLESAVRSGVTAARLLAR